MVQQVPVEGEKIQSIDSAVGSAQIVTSDVAYLRLSLVNVVFLVGNQGWVLVDAGVSSASAEPILNNVEHLFNGAAPRAILLTHGHFDHVGALKELFDHWDVEVFAHPAEHPFLNGSSSYPAPDPSVGGGMLAAFAKFYPRGPIDISAHLRPLPSDGSVPYLPEWQWLHTPGHSPGHVSFWRRKDKCLVAGDAVITTAQESAFSVATQRPEIHGPPMYYTPDWDNARVSVEQIAALRPHVLVSGHGPAMLGPAVQSGLHTLAALFDEVARPQ